MADGLVPAGNDNAEGLPSFHSPEGQTQNPNDWEERVDLKIKAYLLEHSVEYRQLNELRHQGWNNPAGDSYFKKQRQQSDTADEKVAQIFYKMMQKIAQEMHQKTDGALAIKKHSGNDSAILDMCMAPGGFLLTTMNINPGARALGITLPVSEGGYKVLLPECLNVSYKFLDVNMMASDMGVRYISLGHPDADEFLPHQFRPTDAFDLVMCDGQVLRTQERAAYREHREAIRLTVAQLALGLEHLRPGGTMIILLHKAERPKSVGLFYTFRKFSSVKLFKPTKYHTKRSSYYMVVTDVQSQHPEALAAVGTWKKQWEAATFGTNDEFEEALHGEEFDVAKILEDFGPEFVEMGREVWATQARGLSTAPWMKEKKWKRPGKNRRLDMRRGTVAD
ncbi:uncharacterized protein CC84DRAFT_1259984 [Paraphaeosphaeria sporulosa]|uniref:Ribosomal RNA methyltransferase FtsJ domain-containing protein n=1 Tax=Paraphaeosphaeria sporulosa TaxID=1460663 RepID=A0A177CAN8_9PLEO|nr:uncharacterized protein CC84DRAFT_1259984 [Paraphaeosphaeria sporulosa]OAG04635.1 hypothetical protein CC84DRAFT_1259984 [Paraphaeosphaeria sporulosa]